MTNPQLAKPLAQKFTKRDFLKLSAVSVGAVAVGLPLVGCGDGSSSQTSTSNTGRISSVHVEGLAYSSKSHSGRTGTSGTFNYLPGETITFSVGNVIVGTISNMPSDGLITTYHLAGNHKKMLWHIETLVVAQFLQSIHSELDRKSFIIPKSGANGQIVFEGVPITIPQSVHDNLSKIPLTYLNDPGRGHISQASLRLLVKTATDGKKSLISCVTAETNQIFWPTA
ncbi:twin-arginine translocation signal domain-containing protein [Flavobacterium sp.]|jgi:hypothetical protein|uniref:twin-arginine translocation signal domain-containing protein n=1 Tax=Flavobacterium sp. TaxID=239 RepID=UPI0037C0A800